MSKLFVVLALILFHLNLRISATGQGVPKPAAGGGSADKAAVGGGGAPKAAATKGGGTGTAAGDELIQKACHGVGVFEQKCIFTLKSAPQDHKADPKELIFYTLRHAEAHAANVSSHILEISSNPDLVPEVQAAMADCLEQYNPVGDLIEDTINAILAKAYSDATQFIEAALYGIEFCGSQVQEGYEAKAADGKAGQGVPMPKDVIDSNTYLQNMLFAARNIVPYLK